MCGGGEPRLWIIIHPHPLWDFPPYPLQHRQGWGLSSQKGSGAMGHEGSRVHPPVHLLPQQNAPLIPPMALKQNILLLLQLSPLCSSSCPSGARGRIKQVHFFLSCRTKERKGCCKRDVSLLHHPFLSFVLKGTVPASTAITPLTPGAPLTLKGLWL